MSDVANVRGAAGGAAAGGTAASFRCAPYVWTYPEEALLAGPERLAEQIAELGFGGVAVALSYHRARLLYPRHGRVETVPAGHIAFDPDPARYEALVPSRTASAETVRAVHELRAACARRGIGFHAWLVLLHNEALVAALPEAEAQSADGAPVGRSLCPSHPQSAAYVRALVDDVCRQLSPDGIEVEAAWYPSWEPGYTITIWQGEPSARALRLGSQCFCPSCRALFAAAGEDPEALAAETRAAAGPPFALPGAEADDAAEAALAARLIPPRAAAMGRLLSAAAERAHAHGATLRTTAYGEAATVALQGVAPAAVTGVDGVILTLGERSGQAMLDHFAALRALTGDAPAVVSTNWDPSRTPQSIAADVAALKEAGADGVAFYNLALAPHEALPAFAAGAAAAASAGRSVPALPIEAR